MSLTGETKFGGEEEGEEGVVEVNVRYQNHHLPSSLLAVSSLSHPITPSHKSQAERRAVLKRTRDALEDEEEETDEMVDDEMKKEEMVDERVFRDVMIRRAGVLLEVDITKSSKS